jgi:hypothetical protein
VINHKSPEAMQTYFRLHDVEWGLRAVILMVGACSCGLPMAQDLPLSFVIDNDRS